MIDNIKGALAEYWGYKDFLPLQKEAMQCIAEGSDSIVVLPTGGGKSLCFQAPAVTMAGLAVVVSPLISLMKDQIDALTECGVPAGRLDSSLSPEERRAVYDGMLSKKLKLLYLAPERLVSDDFLQILREVKLSFVAIDEAHCVSMWGHDFRPEYRQLGLLKKLFPGVTIAAYTATATEQVRRDIAEQLGLDNPKMLIGSFDRPNLIYKVRAKDNISRQVREVLDRHKGESGIVYCIRRKDVDGMCAHLTAEGYSVAPYHAGMENGDRKNNQDLFISEKVDTIVATIAFGMGIDKSNVRYVVHAGMPKSLEHYQQESGRAGRDGLEAECCLFYSAGDYRIWKFLMKDMEPEAQEIAMVKLSGMYNYCTGGVCRHKTILRYFGQDLDKTNCQACDACLGELSHIDDALVTGQKILSCIIRLGERFGGDYTASVLTGSREKRIIENGHDSLSTYGLLSEHDKDTVHNWIEQLAGQDYIAKTGEYNVLTVTPKGREVLSGQVTPRLLKPARKPTKVSKVAADSWEGVDQGLFEALRNLRKTLASKKGVPAYIVFGDAALRDMARRRPSTPTGFLKIKGVGGEKNKQYGKTVLAAIKAYCATNSLQTDVDANPEFVTTELPARMARTHSHPSESRQLAFDLFEQKLSIEDVAKSVNRAESTTTQYLIEYINRERIANPHPWVDKQSFGRVADAARQVGKDRTKPIFDLLGGEMSHNQIRICLACLRAGR